MGKFVNYIIPIVFIIIVIVNILNALKKKKGAGFDWKDIFSGGENEESDYWEENEYDQDYEEYTEESTTPQNSDIQQPVFSGTTEYKSPFAEDEHLNEDSAKQHHVESSHAFAEFIRNNGHSAVILHEILDKPKALRD